ncbi:MAG: DegQ family serine endoprotease [Verrucomicrobia bacterium]|nr:DegQ family serine endoprotease [Verrucomicrobiota bacterium]
MNYLPRPAALTRAGFTGSLIITALAITLALGQETTDTKNLPPPDLNIDTSPLRRETQLATSFAPVVEKVGPSVVNIYTSKRVQLRNNPMLRDDFFRRFFGLPDENQPGRRPPSRVQQSLGSGVIVSKDGYILTNNHVVDQADEIKVVLANGDKEYEAKLIGKDPQTDVAVLKVEATDLPAITIADSDLLKVGDVVLAIGNPFGVGQTVTMGIVGATGRGGFGVVQYEDFIQTDASINQGNSGGALIDADGRLVGINTFILSPTGGNLGLGFAIPINMARNVMSLLIGEGRVARGYIGVQLEAQVTPELAREFKLSEPRGAIVTEVVEDTPGAKAGLKPGDVITQFNGKRVDDRRHLQLMVSQTPPKTKVDLTVIRDGKERTVAVTLGEFPAGQFAGGQPDSPETSDALRGVEVMDITPQLRSEFSIPRNIEGALITGVDEESPSFEAGLRPGQVILEIDKRPVANADDAVSLGRRVEGKTVLLRVWTPGGSRYVVVDTSKTNP